MLFQFCPDNPLAYLPIRLHADVIDRLVEHTGVVESHGVAPCDSTSASARTANEFENARSDSVYVSIPHWDHFCFLIFSLDGFNPLLIGEGIARINKNLVEKSFNPLHRVGRR